MLEKIITGLFLAFVGFALILVIGAAMAFPLMLAWNHVMPYLFAMKEISFVQAWCLMIVSGTLIKSTLSTTGK